MKLLSFGCAVNQDAETTRVESVKLFKEAKKSIRIVAGDITSDFYNDKRIVNALKTVVRQGVSVEIAYDPKRVKQDLEKSEVYKIPEVKIWKLVDEPRRHTVSVDGKHARVERRHAEGAKITPALVCRDAHLLAHELDLGFESLKKSRVR